METQNGNSRAKTVILIFTLAFTLTYLIHAGPIEKFTNNQNNNASKDNSKPVKGITGEIIDIQITENQVRPIGFTIEKKDGVKFNNKASTSLVIDFKNDIKSINLEEGKSEVVNANSTFYYTVKASDSSEGFMPLNGRVNIH